MMMMKMKMEIRTSFMCKTLTLFILCTVLQDGCGFPLSEQEAPPAHAARPPHVRTKRCSCSSWEDKECIYFCHLDIIWVNTPSKLVPYGLGGSPSSDRRRRSADRCRCLNPADETCAGFCRESSEDLRPDAAEEPQSAGGSRLLASLRSVVQSNLAIAHETPTRGTNHGEVKKPRSGTGR